MENMKRSRPILFVLLLIIGFAISIAFFLYMLDFVRYFASPSIDQLLGIQDVVEMFLITLFFFITIVFNLVFTILSMKLCGIMNQMFPCEISSNTVKLNLIELNPEKLDSRYFYAATDEQLVIKQKVTNLDKYVILCTVLFFAFLGFAALTENDEGKRSSSIVFFTTSFIGFIYWIYMVRHIETTIFDRKTGLVTIPNILGLPSQKIAMEKVVQGNNLDLSNLMGLVNTYTYAGRPIIPGDLNSEWWSFYVWYMDKNRPLPHGTLFEAYHQKDFFRRRAEGFLPPKYPAYFSISDDRYGYVYGSEEFRNQQRLFRINIATAYQKVFKEIWKKDRTFSEEDITLIGIYNQCYVFQLKAPKNQKLELLEESDIPNGSLFIDSKKGKFFEDYREIK